MTIKLLRPYSVHAIGAVITLDADTEASLVQQNLAQYFGTQRSYDNPPFSALQDFTPTGREGFSAGATRAGGDSAARLSASPPANLAIFGHSKSAQNSQGDPDNVNNVGGVARRSDMGYMSYLDYYLGGSMRWAVNAAIGGQVDSQLRARVVPDVVDKAPAWCFIMGGTCNSVVAGLSARDIIDIQGIDPSAKNDPNTILGPLLDAGIRVVWFTDPSWYTGKGDLTPANVATMNTVNRTLMRAAGRRPGLISIDAAAVLANPTAADGSVRQYLLRPSPDDLHPSPKGARAIAAFAAPILRQRGHPVDRQLVSSVVDSYAVNPASRQMLTNPLMQGSGGTNSSPAAVSGTVPTGWRIVASGSFPAGSVVSSVVARADGFGNDWQVQVNNTGADGDEILLIGTPTGLVAGDVIEAAAKVDLTGMAKVKGHQIVMGLSNGVTFTAISSIERDATRNLSSLYYDQSDLTGGVFATGSAPYPTGTLSAGSGDLRLRVMFDGAGGTATIKMGRAQVEKLL